MDIIARFEKLEQENRRMKKAGIVAIVFASVLFISGQAKTSKVVEANEFRRVDDSGRVRARLAMFSLLENTLMQKDVPNLSLYDADGHPRILIAAFQDESRIYLNDSKQTMYTAMWAGSSGAGGSGVGIFGPAGLFLVDLNTAAAAGPALALKDMEGYSTHIGKTDLVLTKTGNPLKSRLANL